MEKSETSKGLPAGLIVWPALKIGALSGTTGLLFGGIGGTIRSSTPVLFALASGIQWFALGSTFWATRGAVIRAWELERVLPKDRVYASGIAGGVSGGGVAALTRGRANVIPGAIMFLIFGALGQKTYNFLDAKHTQNAEVAMNDSEIRKTFLQKVADMKWSPMKVLSDEDYEKMLKERLLRVNAEIAILDEDMASLKAVVDTDCPWKDISGKN